MGPTLVANCGAARAGFYAVAEVPDEGEVRVTIEQA
jgi:hypothetical protein